jgi:hypothetical protein
VNEENGHVFSFFFVGLIQRAIRDLLMSTKAKHRFSFFPFQAHSNLQISNTHLQSQIPALTNESHQWEYIQMQNQPENLQVHA